MLAQNVLILLFLTLLTLQKKVTYWVLSASIDTTALTIIQELKCPAIVNAKTKYKHPPPHCIGNYENRTTEIKKEIGQLYSITESKRSNTLTRHQVNLKEFNEYYLFFLLFLSLIAV